MEKIAEIFIANWILSSFIGFGWDMKENWTFIERFWSVYWVCTAFFYFWYKFSPDSLWHWFSLNFLTSLLSILSQTLVFSWILSILLLDWLFYPLS